MPGQEKTTSTTSAPLSRKGSDRPRIWTSGVAALRSAWSQTIRRRVSPLARAVRTKSSPRLSSRPLRTKRAMAPPAASPRTSAGSTRWCSRSNSRAAAVSSAAFTERMWPGGNTPSRLLKTASASSASQKVGSE